MSLRKVRSFGEALEKYLACTFVYPSSQAWVKDHGIAEDGELILPDGKPVEYSITITDTSQMAVMVQVTALSFNDRKFRVLDAGSLSKSHVLADDELETHERLLGTRDKRSVSHFARRIEEEVARLVRTAIMRSQRKARDEARGLTKEQVLANQITKQFPDMDHERIRDVVKVATLYAKNNKQARELAEEIIGLVIDPQAK